MCSPSLVTLEEAEEALKIEISRISVPSDILERFKIKDLTYHPKLRYAEYFDNLTLATRKAILNPQLIMMIDNILSTTKKEELTPYGENYQHLSVWFMGHFIENRDVLRPLYLIANEVIEKLFISTNFDLLKKEINDLDGSSALSEKTIQLLKDCGFTKYIKPYLIPIAIKVYIGRTYTGTNLTSKLLNTVGKIEDFLIGKDLDAIYGNADMIENDERFISDFEKHLSETQKVLTSSLDKLAIISWIRYFANRFTDDTKSKFLHYTIKELNRSEADNDKFKLSAIIEFLDQANMSRNKSLIQIKSPSSITEMNEEVNLKSKLEKGVKNRKRLYDSTNKDKWEKKRQKFSK